MASIVGAQPGRNWEPETPSGPPTLVTGTKLPVLPSADLRTRQGAGCHVEQPGLQTALQCGMSHLICCTETPAPKSVNFFVGSQKLWNLSCVLQIVWHLRFYNTVKIFGTSLDLLCLAWDLLGKISSVLTLVGQDSSEHLTNSPLARKAPQSDWWAQHHSLPWGSPAQVPLILSGGTILGYCTLKHTHYSREPSHKALPFWPSPLQLFLLPTWVLCWGPPFGLGMPSRWEAGMSVGFSHYTFVSGLTVVFVWCLQLIRFWLYPVLE